MENLSERNELLIRQGLKTCGLNEDLDAYHYIVEELYVDEADEIYAFFQWLWKTRRPFGPVNAQERSAEFKGKRKTWEPLPDWYLDAKKMEGVTIQLNP